LRRDGNHKLMNADSDRQDQQCAKNPPKGNSYRVSYAPTAKVKIFQILNVKIPKLKINLTLTYKELHVYSIKSRKVHQNLVRLSR
jgi:hypothetical protein